MFFSKKKKITKTIGNPNFQPKTEGFSFFFFPPINKRTFIYILIFNIYPLNYFFFLLFMIF